MSDENCSSASRYPIVMQLIFFRVSFLLPLMMGSSLMFLMRIEEAIRCDFMLYKDNVNL